jgi:hypothetical protein
MKLNFPPKLVQELVWVRVIWFCKNFIPSYVFDGLLCRSWRFSDPSRLTLAITLLPSKNAENLNALGFLRCLASFCFLLVWYTVSIIPKLNKELAELLHGITPSDWGGGIPSAGNLLRLPPQGAPYVGNAPILTRYHTPSLVTSRANNDQNKIGWAYMHCRATKLTTWHCVLAVYTKYVSCWVCRCWAIKEGLDEKSGESPDLMFSVWVSYILVVLCTWAQFWAYEPSAYAKDTTDKLQVKGVGFMIPLTSSPA